MPQLVSGVVVVQVSAPKTVVPWSASWSVRRLSKGDELDRSEADRLALASDRRRDGHPVLDGRVGHRRSHRQRVGGQGDLVGAEHAVR